MAVVNGKPVDGPLRKRNYTASEWRLLQLLLDGHGHTLQEVHGLLDDQFSLPTAARMLVSDLRSKMDRWGYMIPFHKGMYYLARKIEPGGLE